MRKINAGLSLLCTFLLLYHAIFNALLMFSKGAIPKTTVAPSWVLFWAMMVHASISIAMAFVGHKGAEKRECNQYPKLNVATIIQRATGMLLIIFTILHVLGATGVMTPPKLVHAILPPLFFALSLMHVSVSTSKAFITLGIGNAKFIKVVDIAVKALCVLILIADVTGFYLLIC